MKTFIKTILQLSLFVTLLFGTTAVADASSFVTDPWADGKGTTTVSNVLNTALDHNSISLSGDEFHAFIAYQNRESFDLLGVEGQFDFDTSGTSDSVTITGKLNASNGSQHNNTAFVTGLPDEWEIEMVSALVYNNHGADGHPDSDICEPNSHYNYNVPLITDLLSNSWVSLPLYAAVLDDFGFNTVNDTTGMCDQGHIIATFRVEDVSDDDVVVIDDDRDLDTIPPLFVSHNSAQLRGQVTSGTVHNPFFVYGTSGSINCSWPASTVFGNFDPGEVFTLNLDGSLLSDTHYYYMACDHADGGGYISGGIEDFYTLGDGGGDDETEPEASTHSPSGISESSAVLHGDIIMHDFDNGQVFFVWGESETAVSNVSYAASYASITEDGDNLQKFTVDGDFDGIDDFDYLASGLDADVTHYYQICVQYYDGGYDVECGGVQNFTTDSDGDGDGGGGGSDHPDATTYSPDEVDENSAELNGYVDMNDFDNGDVFFVWGESETAVENVEDENSYGDVDTDGDNLQKEMVDGDLDGSASYNLDIDGLDADDDHYYRICVDYYDGGDEMVCGSVKHFETDGGDDHDGDSVIETRDREVGSTRADICGDLIYDGGDSNLKTWMEYKRADVVSWDDSTKYDRGEIYYCVTITGLNPGTAYKYRACSEDSCGYTKTFTTAGELPSGATARPLVSTDTPTSIRSNSAILNGFYVSNADSLNVWFNYGRTPSLGKQTRTYDKFGAHGSMSHNFTGLASNTTYYYQAVARNTKGTAVGNILSFRTGDSGSVVVVEKLEEETIDLTKLGLGLSLVRLEIDDDREQVVRGENIEYVVSWENISTLDLTDIDLKVTLPDEVQITNTSRGIFDADQNAIFYTIDDLDDGEDGELTVFGTVDGGVLGSALTAEATLAFDNPVNDAQENATDYDIDELVVRGNLGTASVFGLSNISFLGWLVILLGLLIIFLVARWLYLEREELRAQAYAGGYGRPAPAPAYNYAPPVQQAVPQQPVYQAPAPVQAPAATPAPAPVATDPGYKPYQPNR